MPYYAIGPSANDRLEVREVRFVPLAAEAPTADTGQAVIDVSAMTDPGSLVGRVLDISTPASPTLIAIDPIASRRAEWFSRTGRVYKRIRDDARLWWPDDYPVQTERRRARDVLQYELPLWAKTISAALAAAIAGRAWTGMTAAQIEACVAHIEDFVAGGGVETWYKRGLLASTGIPNDEAGMRQMNSYSTLLTYTAGYTDALQVQGGILVPRDPDYEWHILTGYPTPAADFDPENPA